MLYANVAHPTILAFIYVQITVPTQAPVVICFVTQAPACRQLVGNQQITHFQTSRQFEE